MKLKKPFNRTTYAQLAEDSPRFQTWFQILDSREVPLLSTEEHAVEFEGHAQMIYTLDVNKMTPIQRSRLLTFIANKFHERLSEKDLRREGFPIRVCDVVLGSKLRAFV